MNATPESAGMSGETQKKIYESISAVRDALPTEVAEELLHGLLQGLTRGIATSPALTGGTLRRWLTIEVE